ncbi:endonuclease/exonuclease/phosphatase family protein [Kineococcus rhizosphaerae]|uniref:Endonuclease/exonuclease/phosphatase family metal-dependent hydrolase n=1 Tax=Kineococcus rhizosphaerae TaxID=559628 RepID=A0A2T0R8R4_9ACTN|nr:endonuclease/exonuclease/phosphatase family protein [Kineococcus rhizosphaerae]PRY17494.1 endonuclease/exonuclease/phosphatase family metal-dependent hydrolase [Kineococcus rhizosphaerae]
MSAPAGGRAAARLRVATFNVRELLDDTLAVREVLRAARADVVCLQEVPTLLFAGHRLGDLAADTGLWVTAAGAAGAGTAILTAARVDVRAAGVRALPTARRRGWKPVRRRGTAEAAVRVPLAGGWSVDVLVRSVHLGLDDGERFDHVTRLLPGTPVGGPLEPWSDAPAVLAGDLNEEPGGAVHRRLSTVLLDAAEAVGTPAPTFPARSPRRRLDAVLVDRLLSVTSVSTPGEHPGASDHLPVLADLLVPAAG